MLEKSIEKDSSNLNHVPNDPWFLGMCEKVVKDVPWRLEFVAMSLITQKMCQKAVKDGPWHLKHVPDNFKTQEMCEKVVEKDLLCLEYVPDYFVHKI